MNKITSVTTEHISPSRTIEILNLIEPNAIKQVYVYNYEGIHFRFFDSLVCLVQFFETGLEPKYSFASELELDRFLEKYGTNILTSAFNLQINYRYRDADNYKQFGLVIFRNSTGITVEEATELLLAKLISGEYFVAQDWGIPRLHFHPYNPAVDHAWHEFEGFEITSSTADDVRDILEFLDKIEKGYEI